MQWEALNLTSTEMRNFQRLRSVGQIYDQSPQTFIRFIGMMFQDLGYEVHTNADPDSVGVDLYLRAKGKTALARCENYQGEIGKATINELYSQMSQVGVTDSFVVTTGHYASEAEFYAGGKPIQLIDGTDLWAWYEQSKETPTPAPQPVTRPKPEPVAKPIAKSKPEPRPAPVRKATPSRPPKPVEKKRITPQAIIGILAVCVLLFACFYLVQTLSKSQLVNDVLEDGDQTVITVPEPATATARASLPTNVPAPTVELETTKQIQLVPESTAIVPPTITLASDALPTSTTAPTVPANTPAPLDGSASVIAKRTGSITADGNLTEWGNEAKIPSQHQVFAVSDWDFTDDVYANWQLSWDNNNLYVAASVTDDRHVQIAEPRFAYRGDSVEMQIDTDSSDDGDEQVNLDDYQVLFSPGNFNNIQPSSFRFRGNPSTGRPIAYTGQAVQVGSVKSSNGYVVEAIVPWSDLGVSPSQGMKLRIALNVSDNDTAGTTVQEVMKSHVATREWRDPSTWALFQLGN